MSKKIVIIGNGGGGSQAAAALLTAIKENKSTHQITVLSPHDYAEISVLMTKTVACGTEEHKKVIYDAVREDGIDYIVDTWKELASVHLITGKGTKVPFDVCIVAVGQSIPIFMPAVTDNSKVDRLAFIEKFHGQIKSAQNIVISGGPTGCEAAADIKLRNKDKSVTVVHSADSVLNAMSAPLHPIAMDTLKNMGIDIITNDRVEKNDEEGKTVALKSGKSLPCDLLIPAHPIGGNCGFMPPETIDARNYAKVRSTFQLESTKFDNVFAMGDCSNYSPIKTYMRINDQIPTLVSNVLAFLEDKPLVAHVVSFQGQFSGPGMVCLGHDHPEGIGLGPDCPGCPGWCCWLICCCQPPHGKKIAEIKTDFNVSIKPNKGRGISK